MRADGTFEADISHDPETVEMVLGWLAQKFKKQENTPLVVVGSIDDANKIVILSQLMDADSYRFIPAGKTISSLFKKRERLGKKQIAYYLSNLDENRAERIAGEIAKLKKRFPRVKISVLTVFDLCLRENGLDVTSVESKRDVVSRD
jgi:hypothetical protein